METPRQFLIRVTNNDGNSTVYYKPVEHNADTIALPFDNALNLLNEDIEEMKHFFTSFGINDEEKATQAAFDIWQKHIA